MKKENKEKVPNYVVIQWTGDKAPRVQPPQEWIEQEGVKKYDTIKYSFEIIHRHKNDEKEK